jgi:hypothetical protein
MNIENTKVKKGMSLHTPAADFKESLNEEQKVYLRQVQEIFNLQENTVLEVFAEVLFRHQDLLSQLSSEDEKGIKFAGIILIQPFQEIYVKGQIKYILSTATDENEIVERLKPIHGYVRSIIEERLNPLQDSHPVLMKFMLRERPRFQRLLEELTTLIRSKGNASIEIDNKFPIKEDSLFKHDLKEVENFTPNLFAPLVKKVQIKVNKQCNEAVFECIKLFVTQEQHQFLEELLQKGSCEQEIFFRGKQNLLADLFARLFKNKLLLGAGSQEDVAHWLSQNFSYKNGNTYKKVTISGTIKVISKGLNVPKLNERLCYIEGLK